jgi:polysaccharide export outer membrane protein
MTVKTALLALLLLASGTVCAAVDNGYRMGSGDVLSVNVFNEPDLTFDKISLNDTGVLSFPLIGDVEAKGHTVSEVSKMIADKLNDGYVKNPRVTVSVAAYRPFYIGGEVKKPGGYPYQPGLNVRAAIALAEGKTDRGSDSRITIIRAANNTKEPQRAKLDDAVSPGDTITIEQGFF